MKACKICICRCLTQCRNRRYNQVKSHLRNIMKMSQGILLSIIQVVRNVDPPVGPPNLALRKGLLRRLRKRRFSHQASLQQQIGALLRHVQRSSNLPTICLFLNKWISWTNQCLITNQGKPFPKLTFPSLINCIPALTSFIMHCLLNIFRILKMSDPL